MEFQEESRDGVLIIRVRSSRIDASKAPGLKKSIVDRIENGHTRLVLDVSLVEFIDSIGLGALVSCLKRLGRGGTLTIVGAKGAVSRLFALTHMDRVFPLFPSVKAALAETA